MVWRGSGLLLHATARLPFDLIVYRGVRSLRRTFGVDGPEHISLGPQQLDGYTATSVLRRVAVDLGVFGESDAAKRTALAEWLRSNEPVPNLRMALEFRGFIDADGRPLDAAQGPAHVTARDRGAARQHRVG